MDGGIKRKATVGAFNSTLMKYERFNLDEYDDIEVWDAVPDAVVASAAIPIVFPASKLDGYSFVDGGTSIGTDTGAAIERCLEEVSSESDITVDVIILGSQNDLSTLNNIAGINFGLMEQFNDMQTKIHESGLEELL